MRITTLGNTLSLFLAFSFTICILWGLAMPATLHMHEAWADFLPGFSWLSLPSFLLGLAESYLYGWYIAVVFVPIYRFFEKRSAAVSE